MTNAGSTLTAPAPVAADPRRWKALFVLALMQFMLVLDITVVNVALPHIRVDLGFSRAGMAEIVAQTTVANAPSRRVMEKLGMTYDPADDFSNPRALGTPCEHTVLYRLAARDWTTAS